MQSLKSTQSAIAARGTSVVVVDPNTTETKIDARILKMREDAITNASKAVRALHSAKAGDQSISIRVLLAVNSCIATGAFPRFNGNGFDGDAWKQYKGDSLSLIDRWGDKRREELADMAADDRRFDADTETTRTVKNALVGALLIATWLTRTNTRDTSKVTNTGRALIIDYSAFSTLKADVRKLYQPEGRTGTSAFPFSRLVSAARAWAGLKTERSRMEQDTKTLKDAAKIMNTLAAKDADGNVHMPADVLVAAGELVTAILAFKARYENIVAEQQAAKGEVKSA